MPLFADHVQTKYVQEQRSIIQVSQ